MPLGERAKKDVEGIKFAAMLPKPIKPSPLLNAFMGVFANAPLRSAKPDQSKGQVFDSDMAIKVPLRILLVDDNATNRKLGFKVLERLGYKAELAGDGRSAISSYNEGRHDVIPRSANPTSWPLRPTKWPGTASDIWMRGWTTI